MRFQPSPNSEADLDKYGTLPCSFFHHSRHPCEELHVVHRRGIRRSGVEIAVESSDARQPRRKLREALDRFLPIISGRVAGGGD